MGILESVKDLTKASPEAVDPGSPVQVPALKQFEVWVKLALGVAGVLMNLGIIADGSPLAKYIGAAFAIAGVLGISVSRTMLQVSGNKSAALVESSKVIAEAAKQNPQ